MTNRQHDPCENCGHTRGAHGDLPLSGCMMFEVACKCTRFVELKEPVPSKTFQEKALAVRRLLCLWPPSEGLDELQDAFDDLIKGQEK